VSRTCALRSRVPCRVRRPVFERLAVILTVLHTARKQKADLAAGLAFVFDALARREYTAEDARGLLPDHWPKEKLHPR